MKSAADTVKNVTMELGGKSPIIIWKDADLDTVRPSLHCCSWFLWTTAL